MYICGFVVCIGHGGRVLPYLKSPVLVAHLSRSVGHI